MADCTECAHEALEEGVCTSCGLCLGGSKLEHAHGTLARRPSFSSPPPPVYRDTGLGKTVDRALHSFSFERLKPQLVSLYQATPSPFRLSQADKVLVLLYGMLKRENHPVTPDDMLRMSRLPRHRFLKAHSAIFHSSTSCLSASCLSASCLSTSCLSTPHLTAKDDREYARSIYQRALRFMEGLGISVECTVDQFYGYRKLIPTASAYELCVACMLTARPDPVPLRRLKLQPRSYNEKMRRIIRQVKSAG